MKLTIPCSCQHCGASLQVAQVYAGKIARCPGCGGCFRVQFSVAAVENLQPQAMTLRQLEFACAAFRGKRFNVGYRLNPEARRWQEWRSEYGTGMLDRGAYGPIAQDGRIICEDEPDQRRFNFAEFDFRNWSCKWCGQTSFSCCAKDHLFCKARHNNKYAICPVCGDEGYYTEPVDTLIGEAATFRQPQKTFAPSQQGAALTIRPALPAAQPQQAPRLAERIQRLLLPGGKG